MLALCFVGVFVFIVRYLFSNKYGILYVGSRVYEITYNITKKGRVAARPFSCLFFILIVEPIAVGSYC
jgi:hypothetical protein